MNRPETTVAIDGSLFKHHPRLKALMEHYTSEMAPGKNVTSFGSTQLLVTLMLPFFTVPADVGRRWQR